MATYKVGKGKAWEAYMMETLAVMYEAGERQFTIGTLARWSGIPVTDTMRDFAQRLVNRGWLIVVPGEFSSEPRSRVFMFPSGPWFKRSSGVTK